MKHLRYFDSLARHGHFGRAAEACAISQPALSLQMKELEDILGAALIERGTRLIAFLQQGRIAIYLLYSFITLLTLLVVTR